MKDRYIHSLWQGIFVTVVAVLTVLGCGQGEQPPPEAPEREPAGEEVTMTIPLTSPAFDAEEPIPEKYTADGANVSPPLNWSDLPEGTEHLALIVDDPDAPRDTPFVHWVIYGMAGNLQGLPEDVPKERMISEPVQAIQGVNDFGEIGYGGPAPPEGHGIHHYHFTLYALDEASDLEPGLSKQQVLEAIQGHVLVGGELVGTYER